ncbi:MAG: hypothetical protein ABUL62_31870 [Myxococcales bacterium]
MLIEIQRAACSSKLDADTRHMIMVMILLADNESGRGFASQATIAEAMARSVRHVGALLRALEANADSPITVSRRHRGREDGGRTSDEYVLGLRQKEQRADSPEPQKAPDAVSTPLQKERGAFSLTPDDGSQKERHAGQKANHAGQKEQRADDLLFVGSLSALPSSTGAHQLKVHYLLEFKRLRGVEPVFTKSEWSRAMKALGELAALKGIGIAGGKEVITRALAPDPYRTRIQPWEIRQDANKWRGAQPRKGTAPTVQRGGAVRQGDATWLDVDDEPPDRARAAV